MGTWNASKLSENHYMIWAFDEDDMKEYPKAVGALSASLNLYKGLDYAFTPLSLVTRTFLGTTFSVSGAVNSISSAAHRCDGGFDHEGTIEVEDTTVRYRHKYLQ